MATNAQPLAVIAKLLDLTERWVQELSREGVIPKAERGRYDLVGAVRGYVAYLREQARLEDLHQGRGEQVGAARLAEAQCGTGPPGAMDHLGLAESRTQLKLNDGSRSSRPWRVA